MLQSNWSLVSCNNWNIDMNKRATLIKFHCNFFMDWYFYTIFILYLWAIDSFSIGSDSRKELKNQIKKIQWHWGLNRYRGVHLPLSIQWLSSLKWLMCTHKLQILLVIIFSLPHGSSYNQYTQRGYKTRIAIECTLRIVPWITMYNRTKL